MSITYPLTLYYDAACPMCVAELHALLRHDHDQHLRLVDCSPADFSDPDCNVAGIQPAAMMQRIHARDAAGTWLIGVPALAAAYRAVHVNAVASLLGNQRLAPLLSRTYNWVADHRMLLSRLRLNGLFGRLVDHLVRRQQRNRTCTTETCSTQTRHPL